MTKCSIVVVQLFSKDSKTSQQWHEIAVFVQRALINTVTGRKADLENTINLEQRESNAGGCTQFDVAIKHEPASAPLRIEDCHRLRTSEEVRHIESTSGVEVVVQPQELFMLHQTPGLAVFDMDSTLIQQEVIDELARSVGRYEQVAAVTEAAMRGELDFEASLRARVAELKGVSTDIWETLKADVITFTPGAGELVQFLKRKGWKTAVLSGGFTPLAYWVKDTLDLDYAYANELAVDEATATLSGEVMPGTPVVGAALKRELLLKLAAENNITRAQTLAVGDGSNDLLMMGAAGLGVAFNAKPKVQQAAPARLNSATLLDVAYMLGFSEQEVHATLSDNGP